MNKLKATLRPDGEEGEITVPVLNLSQETGKDVETYLTAPRDAVFEVFSCERMSDAMYSYILYDHRDNAVYAIQSIDLDF